MKFKKPLTLENQREGFDMTVSKLCDDCIKELSTEREGAGQCFTLCKDCNILDAQLYLNTVKEMSEGER